MAATSAVYARNITTKALQFRSAVALAKVRGGIYKDKVSATSLMMEAGNCCILETDK